MINQKPTKECITCHDILPLTKFNKVTRRKQTKLRGECKKCELKRGVINHNKRRSLPCPPRYVTPEYKAWRGMMDRCYRPEICSYPRYGGRGISVYKTWRNDFDAFLSHIGPRPSKDHSVDRINNDGNYAPGNVRWATRTQQQHNTRANINITHEGKTMCIRAWAKKIGINNTTIKRRLGLGLPISRVLNPTPLYETCDHKDFKRTMAGCDEAGRAREILGQHSSQGEGR